MNIQKRVRGLTTMLALLVVGMSGCVGPHLDQRRGDYLNDAVITSRVEVSLNDDPVYKFDGVRVRTSEGTVQLTGTVHSPGQKARAEELARQIPGVDSVVNRLSVTD